MPSDTAANERGIACITISQRLALTQFHTHELKLGLADAKGWSVEAIAAGPGLGLSF